MTGDAAGRIFHGVVVHADLDEIERSLVPVSAADLPPPEVIGFRLEGNPELAIRVLWVSEDRCTAVLIEKCGPCRLIGTSFTQVFYILKGRWTGIRKDGSTYEVGAGDFVCYPEGLNEEAIVHETFVKCSMYHSSKPLPYEVTP